MINDVYYVRDLSGKEIAVYHSSNLDHWNVWGTDNVGKINANGNKFFYIKDHLGSVRVVLNSDDQIVSAIDYDCWGYPLENRSYQSDDINYKFTGKQRDDETGYDYFGARYYDARIANWGSVDPLMEKHIGWNPYNYVLRNPMALIDPDGKQIYFSQNEDIRNEQLGDLRMMVDPKASKFVNYTKNSNGDYIMDVATLKNIPSSISDPVLDVLKDVANGDEPVDIEYRDQNENFNENQKLTFGTIEENKGKMSMGQTLVSGKRTNPEKPDLISVTSRTTIYINRKYGNREAVASLAHELLHVSRYIKGIPWGEKSKDFVKDANSLQDKAKNNYDQNTRASRAYGIPL